MAPHAYANMAADAVIKVRTHKATMFCSDTIPGGAEGLAVFADHCIAHQSALMNN